MRDYRKIKTAIGIELAAIAISAAILGTHGMWGDKNPGSLEPASGKLFMEETEDNEDAGSAGEKKDYIKWVDFDVTADAMKQAYQYDVDTDMVCYRNTE